MEIRLLGPVEVWASGRMIDAGGRRQLSVLAALAADANRALSMDTIIDRVWGDNPPAQVRHTLHAYVTRLRKVLGHGRSASARLVSRGGAYILEVDAESLDVSRLHQLSERARDTALADAARAELLRQALSLWRGEPLAGLGGEWVAGARERWSRLRLRIAVEWAQVELRRGHCEAVLRELDLLTGEYPLSEPLTAMVMEALRGAGRSSEALDHYAELRRRLADELGCEPGPQLQQLHVTILRDETVQPAGMRPLGQEPATGDAAVRPVPAQLPTDVYGFAGRGEELDRLDAIFAAAADEPTAVLISAVSGTAGVGKTALAIRWAHRVRDRFPDGQLYVNLRGYDPGGQVLDPADAARIFLDALGVPAQRMPSGLDARAGLYRSLVAGRRILVVLDNARDAAQVRPLLPGTPTAAAVVTSRDQLTGLVAGVGAHPVNLDVLSTEESNELLTRRLGARAVTAEPDAIDQLITACAGLPLALTIAAAHARQTGLPLAAIAADLGNAATRLDALDTGDAATRIRVVFSWSYDTLNPSTARVFRLLGLHPGPDISVTAAAKAAGLPVAEARRHLGNLVRASLIVEHSPGRFAFHDLLRTFAADLTHTHDPEDARRTALARLLDYYVDTTHTCAEALEILQYIVEPAQADSRPSGPAPGREEALAWFTAEHDVLLACVTHAATTGFDWHVSQLVSALATVLDSNARWEELHLVGVKSVEAARRSGDLSTQAHAHRSLARACVRLGRNEEALTELQHARRLFDTLNDDHGRSLTNWNLAFVLERQDRRSEALPHAERALRFARAAKDSATEAGALNAVGWLRAHLGDPETGLKECQSALTLCRQHNRRLEPSVLDSLGHIHLLLGHHHDAIASFQQAQDLDRAFGNHGHEAWVLAGLGDAHAAAGDAAAAQRAWQHALDIYHELNHPDAEIISAKIRGISWHNPITATLRGA